MSLPREKASNDFSLSLNSLELSTSRRETSSRRSLGISMPTKGLPGITSTTRTLLTDRARAKSLSRRVIFPALVPGEGKISKRVMTGPGMALSVRASTLKSASLISSCLARLFSAASDIWFFFCRTSSSRLMEGRVYISARPLPENKPICWRSRTFSLSSSPSDNGPIFGGRRSSTFR